MQLNWHILVVVNGDAAAAAAAKEKFYSHSALNDSPNSGN